MGEFENITKRKTVERERVHEEGLGTALKSTTDTNILVASDGIYDFGTYIDKDGNIQDIKAYQDEINSFVLTFISNLNISGDIEELIEEKVREYLKGITPEEIIELKNNVEEIYTILSGVTQNIETINGEITSINGVIKSIDENVDSLTSLVGTIISIIIDHETRIISLEEHGGGGSVDNIESSDNSINVEMKDENKKVDLTINHFDGGIINIDDEIIPELKIIMESSYLDNVNIALNYEKNIAVVGEVVWTTNLSDDVVEIVDNILTLKQHYEGEIVVTATAYNASDSKTINVACDIEGVTTYSCENIRQSKTNVKATETSIIVTFDCVATTTYEDEHKETQVQTLIQNVEHTVTFEENLTSEPITRNGSFTCEHGTIINWSVEQAASEHGDNYAWVDLGLPSGTKWAACNVGAENPWDYGKYFQWGDTVGHYENEEAIYNWSTAPFNGGNSVFDIDFFNEHKSEWLDNDEILKPEYDAAHVNMGGNWRMPDWNDVRELRLNTTQTSIDNYEGTGINGFLYTSLINGNTLFFPNSGFRSQNIIEHTPFELWTNGMSLINLEDAFEILPSIDKITIDSTERSDGLCVRGVLKDNI